jgi:hypothetical protein
MAVDPLSNFAILILTSARKVSPLASQPSFSSAELYHHEARPLSDETQQ